MKREMGGGRWGWEEREEEGLEWKREGKKTRRCNGKTPDRRRLMTASVVTIVLASRKRHRVS